MWIMVAGPYRENSSDPKMWEKNLAELNAVALQIFKKGHTPIIGANMALPLIRVGGESQFVEIMKPISLQLADRCDAILRIGGEAPGADHQVDYINAKGGRVFKSVNDIPEVPKARSR